MKKTGIYLTSCTSCDAVETYKYIRVVYIHTDGLKEDTCIYDVIQLMHVCRYSAGRTLHLHSVNIEPPCHS